MQAPTPPSDEQTRKVAARGTGAGCVLFLLGGIALAVGYFLAEPGPVKRIPPLAGVLGLVGVLGGFAVLVLTGLWAQRRTRATLRGLGIGRTIPPQVEAVRRIEAHRLPATAKWADFPTGLQACREIPNGDTPIRFAINLPELRPREKNKPLEVGASYVWIKIPVALPRIAFGPDSKLLPAPLTGHDLDIESEDFNHRFRIYSGPGGPAAKNDIQFARYAHAVLHPRAAQCLLRLPVGVTAIIDGDLACAIDTPSTGRQRIEQIAEVLTELAAMTPDHVLRRWGGQSDYRPRD